MKWFYQKRGARLGPVSAAELDRLENAGLIGPTTLVRCGDSIVWQPLSEVDRHSLEDAPSGNQEAGEAAASSSEKASSSRSVVESPATAAEPPAPAATAEPSDWDDEQAWRSGRSVVFPRHYGLPHRCLKCNGTDRLKREKFKAGTFNLGWFPIVLWITPLNILLALYLRQQRTTSVEYSICAKHRWTRWLRWIAIALCFVLAIWFISLGRKGRGAPDPIALAGLGLYLFGCSVLAFAQSVRIKRIGDRFVRIKGPARRFRESLPLWRRD